MALGALLAATGTPGALADAAPFGLALGQARERDLIQSLELVPLGTHAASRGPMYAADPAQLGMTGATRVTLVFDRRGVLQAVLTGWPGGRFDELAARLAERYEPSETLETDANVEEAPRRVMLRDGRTRILMTHRWPSLELSLDYVQWRLLADSARAVTRRDGTDRGSPSRSQGL